MDCSRHQFLAGAALAGDENCRIGGGDANDATEDVPNLSGLPDDVAEVVALTEIRGRAARATLVRSSSSTKGFCTKSWAPKRIASTASSTVPKAVMTITSVSGEASLVRCSTSRPPTSPILKSVMTRS
jgi:hypothetical protein